MTNDDGYVIDVRGGVPSGGMDTQSAELLDRARTTQDFGDGKPFEPSDELPVGIPEAMRRYTRLPAAKM